MENIENSEDHGQVDLGLYASCVTYQNYHVCSMYVHTFLWNMYIIYMTTVEGNILYEATYIHANIHVSVFI